MLFVGRRTGVTTLRCSHMPTREDPTPASLWCAVFLHWGCIEDITKRKASLDALRLGKIPIVGNVAGG